MIRFDHGTADSVARPIHVSAKLLVNGVPVLDLAVLAAVERVETAKEEGSLFAVGIRTLWMQGAKRVRLADDQLLIVVVSLR